MTGTTTLTCPKCRGEMRTYERNGVLIDQCEECRGIFLDRGELERLIDADRYPEDHRDSEGRDSEGRERKHHDDHEGRGRRRTSPTSFLQDFLGGGE